MSETAMVYDSQVPSFTGCSICGKRMMHRHPHAILISTGESLWLEEEPRYIERGAGLYIQVWRAKKGEGPDKWGQTFFPLSSVKTVVPL